jgi:hypothetical protein
MRAEASIDRFCNPSSGIQLTFTRKGLEVSGYYDHIAGIQGGLVLWDEIDLARRTVFEKMA